MWKVTIEGPGGEITTRCGDGANKGAAVGRAVRDSEQISGLENLIYVLASAVTVAVDGVDKDLPFCGDIGKVNAFLDAAMALMSDDDDDDGEAAE